MTPTPIRQDAAGIDLSPRVRSSTTVVASPALNAETTICSITLGADIAAISGVALIASAAFLVGASGTDVTLKLRRTNTSGTVVYSTGLINAPAAADLLSFALSGFDTGPTLPGQVYVLTLLVTAGAAESTVSAANILAIVV
jgi:hypothetical protein